MKQCTCYALRAIDCTCKPAKYGELYTSRTAKQEQCEPFEYWNAVEGWVKLDEVREHFDSVSCGTIYKNGGEGRVPLYTTPQQRTWLDLTDDEMLMIYGQQHEGKKYSLGRMVQQALKEKNNV